MNSEYNELINKLDTFIRKYYKNQIIRGILLSLSVYLVFFLSVSAFEYFGHFSVSIRSVMFYTAICLIIAVLLKFIVLPVLGYFHIGKIITRKQAAVIISKHFTIIEDKLLNILELATLEQDVHFSKELVLASIDQKIQNIKPIQFFNAIDVRRNYKVAKALGIIMLAFIIILVLTPSLITEGTTRIVKHGTYFEPQAPFRFVLLNDSLFVQKGDDYKVKVGIEGRYMPENVFISFGGNNFIMTRESKPEFSYIFRNINNAIDFSFEAENYQSQKYHLMVLPSPVILDFIVTVSVPSYTGESNRTLKNVGDITVPYGSSVRWDFITQDIDDLDFKFNDSIHFNTLKTDQGFSYSRALFESCRYSISAANQYFSKEAIIRYSINVIPDLYPEINVISAKDTASSTIFYYNGKINDDYGFKRLCFIYNINGSKDTVINIPIINNTVSQEFYYAFDFASLDLKASDKIEYFFEVWDNDAINGSKSSKSSVYEYKVPSLEELKQIEEETAKDVESKIAESMKLARDIKKEINNLKEKNINEKLTTWEKTRKLENINQMHNQLEQLLNELTKENEMKNDLLNSYSEESKQILEKQQQIEELLKNLMNDDLKKLMDELSELMENFNKEKLNDLSEKIDMSYEDLSKQLDRNLELLKQYQIEEKMSKNIEEMRELAKEQEKLSEEVKDKNANSDELQEKQKKQEEQFKKLEQEYDDVRKMNEELQEPMQMNEFKQETEDIKNEFKQGSENMQNGNMKKASGSQKKNSKKMKELADSMESMMNSNMMEQQQESMEDLRQVLENILTFSFDQESLIRQLDVIEQKDPKYSKVLGKQKDLSDDYSIIRDSLILLCKKTPELNSMVTKEMFTIEKELKESLDNLEDHQTGPAKTSQQYVMTSANNLALLLSEALKQMQDQMSMQMQGSKGCQKKQGKGMPSLSQMKGMQEGMKQQLQEMIDRLKKGQGQGSKQDKDAINKRLAQLLAQQEIFQQMLGELSRSQSLMPETQRLINEINNLIKQNENDLVNKNINPQTLQRQNTILTRLLEAETSERQREVDKKRESREVKNEIFRNPADIFQNKGLNSKYSELLNIPNLKMTDYYKKKYKDYLMKLND